MSRISHLIQQMIEFVEDEYDLQEEKIQSQWKLPLDQRIEQGKAIDRVSIHPLENRNLKLICEHNLSKFREGDTIMIHKEKPDPDLALQAVILDERNTELIVKPTVYGKDFDGIGGQESSWIVDEAFVDMRAFYRHALKDKLPVTWIGREIILPLLADELELKENVSRGDFAKDEMKRSTLNKSQSDSVEEAFANEPFYLIQGPPGTGKTLVLAQIARLCGMSDLTVLVTGLSHRAINNALNKTRKVAPDLLIAKLGEEYHARDLKKVRNYEHYSDIPRMFGGIIGCTPFALQAPDLDNVTFDVVLVDESSQITLPLAIMAMLAGERYVFLGDDRQLPPVALSDSKIGKRSIFEYLKGPGCETFLETTYRMNQDLCSWPSAEFYGGRLSPHESVERQRLDIDISSIPYPWRTVLDPEAPLIFVDTEDSGAKNQNFPEAAFICELIKVLYKLGIPFTDMGVVTPFRAQARVIKKLLEERFPELDYRQRRQLVVDTVERMQGQEREVIFVSLVTSDLAYAEKLAEFYFDPRRLNVTVTRARSKLIVVGCSSITAARPENEDHRKWVRVLKDFIFHTKQLTLSDFYGDDIS